MSYIYLIDLLIIPAVIGAYYQSLQLTAMFDLHMIYFFLLLFLIIHMYSTLLIIFSNRLQYGVWKLSMGVIGIGPTLGALFTLGLISLLPFLKWPFYIFKWLPNFEAWISPFIMGIGAWLVQIILRYAVNNPIMEMSTKFDEKRLEIENSDLANDVSLVI